MLVVGSITDINLIIDAIISSQFNLTEVVSGRARGVDALGEDIANELKIPVHLFPANWDKYGKRAGYLRNEEMGDFADALIAIWDGKSRGTLHMINYMKSLNKPHFVKITS